MEIKLNLALTDWDVQSAVGIDEYESEIFVTEEGMQKLASILEQQWHEMLKDVIPDYVEECFPELDEQLRLLNDYDNYEDT